MSRHLSPHGDLTLTRFSSGLAVFYHDLGLLELISTETDSKIGTFCNLQKMNTATTFSVQSDAHKHSTERITELAEKFPNCYQYRALVRKKAGIEKLLVKK